MEKAEKFTDPLRVLESDGVIIPNGHSWRNICWSFVGGCFAGVANVLVGHPLDTLKVRMQMIDISLIKCARTMLKQEGFFSFYQGITSPLYNVPLCYAINLGAYEMGRYVQGVGFHDEMTIVQGGIAGVWAGIASCIVLTPMELVKCKLQMEIVGEGKRRTSAMAMTQMILKNQGIKGLYKGNLICIIREVPGCAVYFGVYEYVKSLLISRFENKHFAPFIAGGVAGFLSWVVSYPQDAVKTRLQLDLEPVKKYPSHKWFKDGGIINCTKDIWRTEGMRGFWRGFTACAARAVVSEAFSFLIYENAKKYFTTPNYMI